MIENLSEIIERTSLKFHQFLGTDIIIDYRHRRCLHWALSACLALRERGCRACINAGTANFRANDLPEPYSTHIGFFWCKESREQIKSRIESGMLPEMHCWAAIPDLGMIVDPTTQFLKTIAEESGIRWMIQDPPKWYLATSPNPDFYYEPNYEATVLANVLAEGIVRESLHVTMED